MEITYPNTPINELVFGMTKPMSQIFNCKRFLNASSFFSIKILFVGINIS